MKLKTTIGPQINYLFDKLYDHKFDFKPCQNTENEKVREADC